MSLILSAGAGTHGAMFGRFADFQYKVPDLRRPEKVGLRQLLVNGPYFARNR
jgi:hypothetical protein